MQTISQLLPQEERLAVSNEQQSLKIGLPKERTFQEKRICLTPDEVAVLVTNGHQILVEKLTFLMLITARQVLKLCMIPKQFLLVQWY